MPGEIKIQAFDQEKELVVAACSALPENATSEEIEGAVNTAFQDGVFFVCATGIGGTPQGAWSLQDDESQMIIVRDDSLYFSKPSPIKTRQPKAVTSTTQGQETKVNKTAAAKKAPAKGKTAGKVKTTERRKGAKAATAKARGNGEVRSGSKTEIAANLLKRKNGCTSAEVLEATGWPAVSMPAMAKAAGLKLRKEKEKGSVTRYFGS